MRGASNSCGKPHAQATRRGGMTMATLDRGLWRRSRFAAVVGATLTLLIWLSPTGRAAEEVVSGSGDAQASVLRVGPTAGGLQVAVTFGQSLADYQGDVARGQSRVVDLGVLGLVLTAESCKGSAPPLDPSWLPPTLRSDSREDGAENGKRATYLGAPSGGAPIAGIGDQQTRAEKTPRGSGTTTLGVIEIPGLLRAAGGVATAESAFVDGETRVARAVSELGELEVAGIARMEGLRWEVEHRSGPAYPDDVEVKTSFSFGRFVLAGQEFPAPGTPEEAAAAFDQLNGALKETGLSLVAPSMQQDGDIVRVTPLAVRLNQSAIGRQTVGRGLEALQPVREPVIDALISADCQFSSLILVGDVALGVGAGSGGLLLELGGGQAMTEGMSYENPFGTPSAFTSAPPPGLALGGGGATTGIGSSGGTGPGATLGAPGQLSEGGLAAPAGDALSAIDAEPAATRKAAPAVAVGLLALAGVAAMAAADFAHMRRSRFLAGTTT